MDLPANLPGRFIPVGSGQVYAHVAGSGSPAVILLSGLGDSSVAWVDIHPAVANVTTVMSYDRAGMGYSTPSDHPRSAGQIATEMHDLLAALALPPPYVMVGHSIGGVHARAFARRYPGEVRGFVFIDSSHEEQVARLPQAIREPVMDQWEAMIESRLGLSREMLANLALQELSTAPFSASYRQAFAAQISPQMMATMLAESRAVRAGMVDSFPESLGDVPVAVLSNAALPPGFPAPIGEAYRAMWLNLQGEIAALSPRSRHTLIEGHHYLQFTHPDAVVDAVMWVVDEVR